MMLNETISPEDVCSIELAIKYFFYGARTHMAGCAKTICRSKDNRINFSKQMPFRASLVS